MKNSLIRILIYFFPALMDMIVALIAFVNVVRLAKMGASASAVAGTVAVWSIVYMIVCPMVGRYVTSANAARHMLASCALMMLLCALFIMGPGVVGIYVLCGGAGAAAALFFPPFQIFMKAVDTAGEKPVTYSTGLYTFAWSAGFAVGPLVAGFLMETGHAAAPGLETGGWRLAYAFAGSGALITALGIWVLKHLAHPGSAAPARAEAPRTVSMDYSRMPNLVWLGWIGAGVGVVVLSIIRAVFPAHAVNDLHLADSAQGALFFLLSLAQAVTGLALCRSRAWMYRPLPVVAFVLIGIAGATCFAFGTSVAVLYPAAVLFGIYSGAFFFYLVFHALTHPVKSARYVAINESVVGVAGIVGPLFGGLLADRFGFAVAALAGVACLALVAGFQGAIHRRHPPVL